MTGQPITPQTAYLATRKSLEALRVDAGQQPD